MDKKDVFNSEDILSDVTIELLSRTENMKKFIKSDMVVGDSDIIKGIIIFEEILKKINPDYIDDEEITLIENTINNYVTNFEYDIQYINNYFHYGINQCYMMLEVYNVIKKKYIME